LLFALPILVGLLPSRWAEGIGTYLPGAAGLATIGSAGHSSGLSPWVGLAVLCLWAAAALVAGGIMLEGRDT